jgi:hypothetical protein
MLRSNLVNRRQFLGRVGRNVGSVALGVALAERIAVARGAPPGWLLSTERLRFGALDPLVDLMQETPADALLPLLVTRLRGGTSLADVVGAAALANARALGGTNYNGYHALMAMVPSFEMSTLLEPKLAPLPVLKVVHRNARFLADAGRTHDDALAPIPPLAPGANGGDPAASSPNAASSLAADVRARDLDRAERDLAALAAESKTKAFEEVQEFVRDDGNVHRIVLSWRAFDLLRFAGESQATTLLRQSVRFCVDEDGRRAKNGAALSEIGPTVHRLVAQHRLFALPLGHARLDDARIEQLADVFFRGDSKSAAETAAATLAEGADPEDVGLAISLAATKLVLHDPGRSDEQPGKPRGSVHGASVGVHASDSANAWRHVARASSPQTAFASLIAGAFHTAGQTKLVGEKPFDHDGAPCAASEPAALLRELDGKVRERDQKGACAATRRYAELGHDVRPLLDLLLRYALSEDGALHAEKYFHTIREEHAAARPAHRTLHLVALARVTASSFGFPAPGYADATKLLAS